MPEGGGGVSRAYIRIDPGIFERKVIQQGYTGPEFAALMGALCFAEQQTPRGLFRDDRVLRALLGPLGRFVPTLVERGDLVSRDGRLYVDGWEEWQEGDVTVRERMARIRGRNSHRNVQRNDVTEPTVSGPSSGTKRDIAGLSPSPAERGRRKEGTNPRAVGTNPREQGTNPRAVEYDRKHGPTKIGDILRRAAAVGTE